MSISIDALRFDKAMAFARLRGKRFNSRGYGFRIGDFTCKGVVIPLGSGSDPDKDNAYFGRVALINDEFWCAYGGQNGANYRVCLAHSKDGYAPFMKEGSTGLVGQVVSSIFKLAGKYYLFFRGTETFPRIHLGVKAGSMPGTWTDKGDIGGSLAADKTLDPDDVILLGNGFGILLYDYSYGLGYQRFQRLAFFHINPADDTIMVKDYGRNPLDHLNSAVQTAYNWTLFCGGICPIGELGWLLIITSDKKDGGSRGFSIWYSTSYLFEEDAVACLTLADKRNPVIVPVVGEWTEPYIDVCHPIFVENKLFIYGTGGSALAGGYQIGLWEAPIEFEE